MQGGQQHPQAKLFWCPNVGEKQTWAELYPDATRAWITGSSWMLLCVHGARGFVVMSVEV